MIRVLTALLLLSATAVAAQQPSLTAAQRQRVAVLGQALARCHGQNVAQLARTPLNPAQITDRVLTACAAREAPIRQMVVRLYGAAAAPRVFAAQRTHYRQVIGQLIARARQHG